MKLFILSKEERETLKNFNNNLYEEDYRLSDEWDCSSLEEKGLCYHLDDNYYHLTEKGIKLYEAILIHGDGASY